MDQADQVKFEPVNHDDTVPATGVGVRDAIDAATVTGLVALYDAARQVDHPREAPPTPAACASWLRNGDDGEPALVWLRRDDRGRAVAVLTVGLPQRDNAHRADLGIVVHPEHRRQGYGTELFEHGRAHAVAAGRNLIIGGSLEAAGPSAFAETLEFSRASVGVQRRQYLADLDWQRLDELFGHAATAAAGYRLVRFVGAMPEEHLPQFVDLTLAMNDAPTDELQIEDEVPSPERIRAYERAVTEGNGVLYRIVAQREADGAFGGYTAVVVNTDLDGWAFQNDTGVARDHRGHRLGLLLKLEMLHWLTAEQPQTRWLDTWNAASNAHMIAVNEDLGYHVISHSIEWQRSV